MRTINIDISDLYRARGLSGIQRFVREVTSHLVRLNTETYRVRVMRFDYREHHYLVLAEQGLLDFLSNAAEDVETESIFKLGDFGPSDIFLDIDSTWNSPLKRPALYAILAEAGTMIVTLMYDMLPLQFPERVHPKTLRTWSLFVSAVYSHADLVLVISRSAEVEFLRHKELLGVSRHIPTTVVGCGSDFTVRGAPDPAELNGTAPFLSREYILFVGTIEPRKMHAVALEALSRIHESRSDVHLVFAGRLGWHSEHTYQAIINHPLFALRIHWVDGPTDDLLETLYANAAMTMYLSHGEGYGLPVAESLARGKITLSSIGTSLFEVGGGFADYVHFNTATEAAETALAYLSSPSLRKQRIAQIKSGFSTVSWATVASTISSIFENLDVAAQIAARPRPKSLQWVFISNVMDSLRRTIPLLDTHVDWVSEYLVVAPADMEQDVMALPTARPVRFIAEERMLGGRLEEFRASDHVRKNWMLRSSLATLAEVDDEFIMLDDDNQPLVDIPIETFLGDDPRYRGYFFYEVARWPHRKSAYDIGQAENRDFLQSQGLELLAYSSHQPQVINKAVFAEAVGLVNRLAPDRSVDEWTVYFNYLATRYPSLVAKKPFLTLNWPEGPWSWEHQQPPAAYLFENYYPNGYREGSRAGLTADMDVDQKITLKMRQEAPYRRSQQLLAATEPLVQQLQLAHGAMVFSAGDKALMVSGVPHVIPVAVDAVTRLRLTFVQYGRGEAGNEMQFCYRIIEPAVTHGGIVDNANIPTRTASNGLLEFEISSLGLNPGVYDLEFYAQIDGEARFIDGVSYRSKLVVVRNDESVPAVYAAL